MHHTSKQTVLKVKITTHGDVTMLMVIVFTTVLPSVISVLVQSGFQLKTTLDRGERRDGFIRSSYQYLKWFLLGATIVLNSAVCLVFIPYIITNALPMLVGFIWLFIPLLAALVVVYAAFITAFMTWCVCCKKEEGQSRRGKCGKLFRTHCLVGLQVFGCLILSMAYNYSQYCYFGGGYIRVISYEFQSRETVFYFNTLGNDSSLVTHNILAFF